MWNRNELKFSEELYLYKAARKLDRPVKPSLYMFHRLYIFGKTQRRKRASKNVGSETPSMLRLGSSAEVIKPISQF